MKPDWKDAPKWANWLFWCKFSDSWVWCSQRPRWSILFLKYEPKGAWVYARFPINWAGNGRDSLEPRP